MKKHENILNNMENIETHLNTLEIMKRNKNMQKHDNLINTYWKSIKNTLGT